MEERISEDGPSSKALVKLNAEAPVFIPRKQVPDGPKTGTKFAFNFPQSVELPSGLWTYAFQEHDHVFAHGYFKPSTPPPDRPPISQAELNDYFKTSVSLHSPADSREYTIIPELSFASAHTDLDTAPYLEPATPAERLAVEALQSSFGTVPDSPNPLVSTPNPRRTPKKTTRVVFFEELKIPKMDESAPPIVNTPQCESLFVLFGRDDTTMEFFHTWAQVGGFHPHEVIPAMPSYYAVDVIEGRALYVHNVPYGCLNETFRDLFRRYNILRDPCLIDLNSEATFRWIVLKNAEEADHALTNLQNLPFRYRETNGVTNTYVLSMCKASRISYELGGAWPLERFMHGDTPLAPATYIYPRCMKEGPGDPRLVSQFVFDYHGRQLLDSAPGPSRYGPPYDDIVYPGNQNPLFQGRQETNDRQAVFQGMARGESRAEFEEMAEGPFTTEQKGKGKEIVDEATVATNIVTIAEQLTKVKVAPEEPKPKLSSWAEMASTSAGEPKTINLKPAIKNRKSSLEITCGVYAYHPAGHLSGAIVSTRVINTADTDSEPLSQQARLIFLFDLPSNMNLEKISNGIKEGPLVSIRMGINEDDGKRYAGIIFQFARDAEAFFNALCKERVDKRPDRFHFIVDVARGEDMIPMDETIKAMGPPTNATRRLTIVKSRFFFFMREAQLREFCSREVGGENIQLVWLYNGGNATDAFAKVDDAIKVKNALEREVAAADPQSHFFGLGVSYSKDPCVQEINLVSDFQDH